MQFISLWSKEDIFLTEENEMRIRLIDEALCRGMLIETYEFAYNACLFSIFNAISSQSFN